MTRRNNDSGCGGMAAAVLLILMLGLLVVGGGGLYLWQATRYRQQALVAERAAALAAQKQAEAAVRAARAAEAQLDRLPAEPSDDTESGGEPISTVYGSAQTPPENPEANPREQWSIVVHGGAGSVPIEVLQEKEAAYRNGLRLALVAGKEILENGATSLAAVEAAIRILEDDPHFNAGKGAVFNSAGEHELDASIMDGSTLDGGGVAGVKTVKNPISLARLVMNQTKHVLLAGAGAETFATEQRVARVANAEFSTDYRRQAWERIRNEEEKDEEERRGAAANESARNWQIGTVGCVALDTQGNIAAGTSTGGLTNKKFGRVGDSPLLGAGTYAENSTCGISGTGIGEQFIRHAVAAQISLLMKHRDWSLQKAARYVMESQLDPGDGGVIGVDGQGNIVWVFTTPGMFRAAATASGRFEIKIADEL